MHPYLKLLRPEQYIKNVFIGAPLFFSGGVTWEQMGNTFLAFLAFCAIASSVYIFNDSRDVLEDQAHPVKKNRPIASGVISLSTAYRLTGILIVIGFTLAYYSHPKIVCILALYLIINILYSIRLKQIALVDVSIIAIGFLLRLWVGSMASSTLLSIWIILETYLLALFLALAKRRTDYILHLKGVTTRKNIEHYNLAFIDTCLGILSALISMAYLMYCMSPAIQNQYHSEYIYISAFFVLNGLLRYLKLAIVDQTPLAPNTLILTDRYLQFTFLGWILFMGLLLYGQA